MDLPHLPLRQGTVLRSSFSEGPQLYGAPVVHNMNQLASTVLTGYLFPHSLFPASGYHLPNKPPAPKLSSEALLCEGTKYHHSPKELGTSKYQGPSSISLPHG